LQLWRLCFCKSVHRNWGSIFTNWNKTFFLYENTASIVVDLLFVIIICDKVHFNTDIYFFHTKTHFNAAISLNFVFTLPMSSYIVYLVAVRTHAYYGRGGKFKKNLLWGSGVSCPGSQSPCMTWPAPCRSEQASTDRLTHKIFSTLRSSQLCKKINFYEFFHVFTLSFQPSIFK
jgi:hypothetical protein